MAGKLQRFLVVILLLAGFFSQGICLALYFKAKTGQPGDAGTSDLSYPEIAIPVADRFTQIQVVSSQQHRQIAEQYILNGNSGQALPHLFNAVSASKKEADDDLCFRLALCFEAVTDFRKAAVWYETAYTRSSDPVLTGACRNGLARCRLKLDDAKGARQLLWRQYLLSNRINASEADNEVLFLLALSYRPHVPYSMAQILRSDFVFRSMIPTVKPENQLKLIIDARQSETDGTEDAVPVAVAFVPRSAQRQPEINISNIIRAGDGINEIIASYAVKQANLVTLFEWISEKLEISIGLTDAARATAEQQSVSLLFDNVDVPSIMDAQTLPFGLGWSFSEGHFSIFSLDEAPDDVVEQIETNSAVRLLERFQITSPDHPNTAYLRFQLAGFYLESGQTASALAIYSDLLDRRIEPELRQLANYNVGQLQSLAHNETVAIDSYSRVVDSGLGGTLAPAGFVRLGQLNLQMGLFSEANNSFKRAARMSDDGRIRQIATIGIVSTYLFEEQYQAAMGALKEDILLFVDPDLQEVARFLFLLGDVASGKSEMDLLQRKRLLGTLTGFQWPAELGAHGSFLKYMAYDILGFRDEANSQLRVCIEEASGAWLRRKSFSQLVTAMNRDGKIPELRSALVNSTGISEPGENGRIQIRLAELELQEGNEVECLTYCRDLLENETASEFHAQALNLMGRVYTDRQDYYHAALCFAGLLPVSEDRNEESDTGQ